MRLAVFLITLKYITSKIVRIVQKKITIAIYKTVKMKSNQKKTILNTLPKHKYKKRLNKINKRASQENQYLMLKIKIVMQK